MNNLDIQNDDTLYEDSYKKYIEYVKKLGLTIETNQRYRILTRREFSEKIRTSPLFREMVFYTTFIFNPK